MKTNTKLRQICPRIVFGHSKPSMQVLLFCMLAGTAMGQTTEPVEEPTEASEAIEEHDDLDTLEDFDSMGDLDGDPLLEGEDDLDLGLDDSIDLLFEDFNIVVSASRSAQSANMAPVPVSILSSDDIHYSGVGELPELFEFVPGFDALRIDKNRWSLGVRGLNQVFSDRTLFLMNGRNVSNPVYGGVDFPTLPIFLEDIEQVEVVRGPGGAAWGANAFNGVVNVIEKDPRDTTGLLLSTRINEHGDQKSNLRFGAANEKFAWRLSAEFEELDPRRSPNLLTSVTATGPALNEDFRRSAKMKFSGVYSFEDDNSLDFGVATTHVERSDSPFTAQQYDFDERLDLVTAHAKFENDTSDGSGGYIQWYGSYHDNDRPSLWAYSAFDQSIDGQYSFERGENHTTTIGGTARFVSVDIDASRSTDAMNNGSACSSAINGSSTMTGHSNPRSVRTGTQRPRSTGQDAQRCCVRWAKTRNMCSGLHSPRRSERRNRVFASLAPSDSRSAAGCLGLT